MDSASIFNIASNAEFENTALQIFDYQYNNNKTYKTFCDHLKIIPSKICKSIEIPCLPIQFFKTHQIISGSQKAQKVFTSSSTTGVEPSKHYVYDLNIYKKSFLKSFKYFYGDPSEYIILALLPSYLEREGSSLIYMVTELIKKTNNPESGFYLHNTKELYEKLQWLDTTCKKVMLIGVSFALLDFVEAFPPLSLKNTIVMETGGMKGRRKELIRKELHTILCKGFSVPSIHSEYGMTELLSQAYSKENGIYKCPPWMKVFTRDTEDALSLQQPEKTGGINIIDLANVNSCSFIATQDLGKIYSNGNFEVLGRFDHSDIRGCNLMAI
ncbi:acyl transferase [Leptobacterium sp. I13]|uniref:acyl transferase n=1 Tax=Leptobacterium meishanense TaxID=3128904 RepID=UPI0030EC1FED